METLQRRLKQRVPVIFLKLSDYLSENPENGAIIVTTKEQYQLLETIQEITHFNPFYCRTFIKKLVEVLENNKDLEIIDEIYETLYELLPAQELQPTDQDKISYTLIPSEISSKYDKSILIRESQNLISGLGTTGLRTWEASFFFAPYLVTKLNDQINNWEFENDFKDKVIMELGCGTGLVGLSLFKYYSGFKKLIMTDGDSQLIDNISQNLILNGISLSDGEGIFKDKNDGLDNMTTNQEDKRDNVIKKSFEISKLWWGEDDLPKSEINTIIASDVTYDSSVIPYLAEVIAESMSQDNQGYGKVDVAYVAAAVRSEGTSTTWENYLDMGVQDQIWKWVVIETKPAVLETSKKCSVKGFVNYDKKLIEANPIWCNPGTPEIKIYRLERVSS